jgi:hypothetical protein
VQQPGHPHAPDVAIARRQRERSPITHPIAALDQVAGDRVIRGVGCRPEVHAELRGPDRRLPVYLREALEVGACRVHRAEWRLNTQGSERQRDRHQHADARV